MESSHDQSFFAAYYESSAPNLSQEVSIYFSKQESVTIDLPGKAKTMVIPHNIARFAIAQGAFFATEAATTNKSVLPYHKD